MRNLSASSRSGGRSTTYAHVDNRGGDERSARVAPDCAAARASPYRTVNAAVAAIWALRSIMLLFGVTVLTVPAQRATAAELVASTPAEAAAGYAKAAPGDVLKLTGTFDQLVVLRGRSFSPALIIDARGASLSAVILDGASGVTWIGGSWRSGLGRPAITVSNFKDVTVRDIDYRGDGTLPAIQFRSGEGAAVLGGRLERPRVGVGLVDVARARVVGVTIFGWSADGIALAGVTDSEILRNACVAPIAEGPGIHLDCIQGYFAWPRPNLRIRVADNYIQGWAVQGVFFNTATGWPVPEGIVAENNLVITGDAPNGVALDGPTNSVRNNRALTLPGSQFQTMVKAVGGAASCGNYSEAYSTQPGVLKGWPAVTAPGC